ncbi:MAG: AAA family ATPase [Bryobacteraceae bacterium]
MVLVGLPGSGKSTYIEQLGATALSSDEIRRLLSDDPANQAIHRRVFPVLRNLLKHRVELARPVTYIDATNLTERERRAYIKLAELYDCEIEAMFFDIPIAECQKRNRARGRVVPDEAISEMAARLSPPRVEEGFFRVIVVR